MKGSSLLHGTFRTGITLKGIGGLLETAGGVLIWFVGPARLAAFVQGLLEREEQRNPYDFISAHFLHLAHAIGRADPVFASATWRNACSPRARIPDATWWVSAEPSPRPCTF